MDNLMKIYNQLFALRENLPQEKFVGKKYVDEFHSLLNKLEIEVNYSMTDFRIGPSILQYTSGISTSTGFEGFGEKQCERGFLLVKLDAILLQFRSEEEKKTIGFQLPKK